MGIYDREYYSEGEPGFQARLPQTMVMRIMLLTVVVYVVQQLAGDWFTGLFALQSDWYQRPWLAFQLLTYGFLHAPRDLWHIVLNMYVLWLFGSGIEQRYGSKELLVFYLCSVVFAGLVYTIAEIPTGTFSLMLGASGAISALLILFAFNFPHRTLLLFFVLPMPMWLAACIFVGLDMIGAMNRSGNVAFTAHLGGAAFGALYYLRQWRLSDWFTGRWTFPRVRRGPKLRVHHPEPDEDPLEEELDRILKKINEQGQASLTRSERKTLERASRDFKRRRQ